ncbi:MAG: RNA methyltransferase [Planctomycetaceae bacterium]|nr:RNA methyltransferase [Planctomycetaceae bacterium]
MELRNPHSVLAALDVRPRAVRSVRVSPAHQGTPWEEVVREARRHAVGVSVAVPEKHQRGRGRDTERTGAGSAEVEPPSPVPLNNLWKSLTDDSTTSPATDSFGIWLALDQVQDPQNLGAVFRLAGFFGVRGIILTKDKSAPVSATVCDVAVGGTEYVPFAVVANLAHALQQAQKAGVWILGTCERAETNIRSVQADRHWMLVMGNEGDGMRRLTRETCDQLVSLSPLGKVPSMNIATATAACLTVLTTGT